jgi:hypothetical protein
MCLAPDNTFHPSFRPPLVEHPGGIEQYVLDTYAGQNLSLAAIDV